MTADQRLLRLEDARLLTGRARFVDDVHLDRMVHAAFVRSPHAHAEILSINTAPALAAGALAIITAADLPFAKDDLYIRYWHPSIRKALPRFLATDRVRHVGEAVAVVIAEDRYFAEDFAALVDVDYRPLTAVSKVADALAEGVTPIHPNWPGNVAANYRHCIGNAETAMQQSARRISRIFHYGRQTGLALETRGCVAAYDAGRDSLTLWISTQTHYGVLQNLANLLRIPEYNIRVIAEDVGGGFGSKSRPYLEEIVIAHASRVLDRPVKWIEDRSENLQATTHARGIETEIEIGYDENGRIEALKSRLHVDVGAYVFTSGIITAEVAASHCAGPYRVPHVDVDVVCVGTNKTPLATYRGAGQPEATFALECMMDLVAKDVGVSATEIRHRNLIRPEDLPYHPHVSYGGPNCRIESGDFPKMLSRATDSSIYHEIVEADGNERMAWGLACGMESTGLINYESAKVQVDGSGNVLVYSGLTSHGQGQATTLTKVCADALGVPPASVSIRMGDTSLLAFGRGTFASRGAVVGANAVFGAAQRVRQKALECAGRMLQCVPSSLSIAEGHIRRADGTGTALTLGDVARALQPGAPFYAGEATLEDTYIFDTQNLLTFAVSVHAAKVAVKVRTGIYRVVDYLIVHDAGVMLNKMIVEGQLVGAAIDGIGATMLSEILYDDQAQLLTGSLADYLVATAPGMPRVRLDHIETLPTTNPLGVRGVGEGGIIPVAPAIVNAIARAIGPCNVGNISELYRVPVRPENVLRAMTWGANRS